MVKFLDPQVKVKGLGCYHLAARIRVPSPPSTLLSFTVKFVLHLSCEKNENKQKEAVFGPFLKGFIMGMALQRTNTLQ